MMRTLRLLGFVAAIGLVASVAAAQTSSTGAIAGVARDTTGAVLPGVTVEASSPALIEKVRTAVTDDQGNYKIIDLRPGTYAVTFTLPGFSTFKREGIELSAGFTAAANAEMKVGGLEETVTVTGASPVVDVQNVRTQNVLTREVMDSLPNNKTVPAFAALTLGATVGAANQDVGGNKGEPPVGVSIHGSRFNDSKLLFDGMPYNSLHLEGGGQMRTFLLNNAAVQETVLGTGGTIAEAEVGGVLMNHVPREGSNRFSAHLIGNFANESFQSDNLTDALRARGLTTVNPVKRIYDVSVGVGGPIKEDRLWFYSANRWWNSATYVAGGYYNKSTSNFRYEPDLSRRSYGDTPARDNAFRITWQAASKHKINFGDNIQKSCQCFLGLSALTSPEATPQLHYGSDGPVPIEWLPGSHLIQATWTYPRTNRLLIDAGASFGLFAQNTGPLEGVKPTDIRITESTTGQNWGASVAALTNGTAYGLGQRSDPMMQRAGASYVTGSHAIKVGMNSLYGRHYMTGTNNQDVQYTFRNGSPISITQWASPFEGTVKVKALALFAQDQWTVGRVTLSGGLRYDNYIGWAPAQTRPGGQFVPAFSFDRVDDVPNFKDVSPRGGAAWDVFGNGKTALKVVAGRYLASMGSGIAVANLRSIAIGQSAARNWADANANFVPDCALTNFAANGECGALTSSTFGRPVITTRYAPDIVSGWNSRGNNVQTSVVLQHELRPAVGLMVGYFRTSWGNFPAQENVALTEADFTKYCLTAPADSRLPDGGGYQVCGLYDVNPNKFGQVDNVITRASHFGGTTEVFNGVDVGLNARFGNGGYLAGGVSTGRTVRDTCAQNAQPHVSLRSFGTAVGNADPGAATTPRIEGYCNVTPPWSANTQVKANAVYPLPWDVQASFTFQNLPGIDIAANLNATNAQVAPSLGRNLASCPAGATASGCTATVAGVTGIGTGGIPLIKPQTMFEDRLNQFDIRLTKIVRVGGTKVQGMFDIYNLFNASTILAINQTYGPAWLRPTQILGARLFKIGGQIDW